MKEFTEGDQGSLDSLWEDIKREITKVFNEVLKKKSCNVRNDYDGYRAVCSV